jgi:hypothetical protein
LLCGWLVVLLLFFFLPSPHKLCYRRLVSLLYLR